MVQFTNLDAYRRVPVDLTESTQRGSILSTIATFVMTTLFLLETRAYLASELEVTPIVDHGLKEKINVYFDITMLDMSCEYATIDAFSATGTQQNVTKKIEKHIISSEGEVLKRHRDLNKKGKDVHMFDPHVEESIEELHADGEDAVSLDKKSLEEALRENDYVFVDYYAAWCSHCIDLAPTWETLAEVMNTVAHTKARNKIDQTANDPNQRNQRKHRYAQEEYLEALKVERPAVIAKVDCAKHVELCTENNIRGYPTLRMYVDGERIADYNGHRTVVELTYFLGQTEANHKSSREHGDLKMVHVKAAAAERTLKTDEQSRMSRSLSFERRDLDHVWADKDHPGCQIKGKLTIDHAPGHFRIQAQSRTMNTQLAAHMTNVSHVVTHLGFGNHMSPRFLKNGLKFAPKGLGEQMHPIDGKSYVTQELHTAHHHHLKVIDTGFPSAPRAAEQHLHQKSGAPGFTQAYQVLYSGQLSYFAEDVAPEAKISYDLSPMAMFYKMKSRHLYDYLTSVMAIIGGTYVVFGMMESGLHSLSSKKNR